MQERINTVVVIGEGAVGCSYAFAIDNESDNKSPPVWRTLCCQKAGGIGIIF